MRNVCPGVLALAVALWAAPSEAATCESLRTLKLANTTITSAQHVAEGKFRPPGINPGDPALALYSTLPEFCRLTGVIRPSVDSHIEFEVWLPVSRWNSKYWGVGNGGSGGFIAYSTAPFSNAPSLAEAIRSGFEASSTDTGHRGAPDDTSFGRGHPEKRIDYRQDSHVGARHSRRNFSHILQHDAWEWMDDPDYPAEFTGYADRFSMNSTIYAMTH